MYCCYPNLNASPIPVPPETTKVGGGEGGGVGDRGHKYKCEKTTVWCPDAETFTLKEKGGGIGISLDIGGLFGVFLEAFRSVIPCIMKSQFLLAFS